MTNKMSTNDPRRHRRLTVLATLLLIVCFGPLIAILTLLWLGLGLENGKALVASLLAIAVFAFSTEIVRRRFRISLRAFFVVFTVIGLALGMFGQWLYQARQEKALVAHIRQLGGRVYYDYQDVPDSGWLHTKNGIPIPTWLQTVFGDSPFADVYTLDLSRSQCQDADLAQFVEVFPNITVLDLRNTAIMESGLTKIAGLKGLQTIWLGGEQTTEGCLHAINELNGLKEIILVGPKVTDKSAIHLRHVSRIRRLNLLQTAITNDGLQCLSFLKQLEFLNLNCPKITDSGLAHLKSLSSLKSLHIEKTPITDEGLVHLRTLSNVQHITFFRTGVTAEGMASLKEKLPNCDIRN